MNLLKDSEYEVIRVPAVCGRSIDLSRFETIMHSNWKWFRNISPAEIGCYLSHIKACKLAKENNHDRILLLEDDIVTLDNTHQDIADLFDLDKLPADYIKLSGGKRKPTPFYDVGEDGLSLCVNKGYPARTTAQILSKKAIDFYAGRDLDFFRPIDVDQKFFWELPFSLVTTNRPVLIEKERGGVCTSTIGSRDEGKSITRILYKMLIQFRYDIKTVLLYQKFLRGEKRYEHDVERDV